MDDEPEASTQLHNETTPDRERGDHETSSRVELLDAPRKKMRHGGKRRGNKARRLTYDTDRSNEGNNQPEADSPRKLLEVRIHSTEGTWVQCCNAECQKWRYLADVVDPTEVPEMWYCSMNNDAVYKSCDIPEEDTSQIEFVDAKFFVGSIVWAKLGGYPWWPAMVDDDPDSLLFYCNEDPHDELRVSHYHVVFLDTQVSRAWIKSDKIVPYQQGITLQKIRKNQVPRYYEQAYRTAKKNAELSLKLPLAVRIKKFCFLTRYTGKLEPRVVPQKKNRGKPRKQTNGQDAAHHASSFSQSQSGGCTFRELSRAHRRSTKRTRGQSQKEPSHEPSPHQTFSAIDTLRRKKVAVNSDGAIDKTLEATTSQSQETTQSRPKSAPKKRGRKRKDEQNDKETSSRADKAKRRCEKPMGKSKGRSTRPNKADGNNRSTANKGRESTVTADDPNTQSCKSNAVSAVPSAEGSQEANEQADNLEVHPDVVSPLPSSAFRGWLIPSESQHECTASTTTQPSTCQASHAKFVTRGKHIPDAPPKSQQSTDATPSADRTRTNLQAGTTPHASSTQLVPPSDVTQQIIRGTAPILGTAESEVIVPVLAAGDARPEMPSKMKSFTQPSPKESNPKTTGLQQDSPPFSTLSADTPLPHINVPFLDSESDLSRSSSQKQAEIAITLPSQPLRQVSPDKPKKLKLLEKGLQQSGPETVKLVHNIPIDTSHKDAVAQQLPSELHASGANHTSTETSKKPKRSTKDSRAALAKAQSTQDSTSNKNGTPSSISNVRAQRTSTDKLPGMSSMQKQKQEAKASKARGSNQSVSLPQAKHGFRVPGKTSAEPKDGAGAKIIPLFKKQKSVSVGTKARKPRVDSSSAPSSSAPDDSDFESLSNSQEFTFHASPSPAVLEADDFLCLEKLCGSQVFDDHEE